MQAAPAQAYTYFHNNGGWYTYNMSVAFPVAHNQSNLDVPDLTYAAASPESIASPRTPDVNSTSLPLQQTFKKSKSRRPKDPNHVGRPANSFMIFRSEHNAFVQKTGNALKINQQDISRDAARLWRNLPSEEKQRYVDAAAEQSRKQREDRESHPDGLHSKRSKKRNSASVKRARVQKPYDRPPNKTTKHVNDAIMPLETVPGSPSVPGPSPDQWLVEPQPSQFINPMLTQCIPMNVVEQTDYATVNPQFDLRLDSTYWQPMLPSINTTTQLPILPPTDQQNQSFALSASEPFDFDNWLQSDDSQQLLDQILTNFEASQQS